MADPLPPPYVKPPQKGSGLDEQAEDDPLDARTMPHATRSGPPSANKHGHAEHELASRRGHPAKHSHQSDRKSGWSHEGRHLPSSQKKKGNKTYGAGWVGPERDGEAEAIDEQDPVMVLDAGDPNAEE